MGARSIDDLPDDSLRWILLRLDSPLCLIRAACVCKRWRRAVTDGADEGRAFLCHASSLHPPTVVGQYHIDTSGDHRQFVPSSSPSPIDCSRFSVDDFLEKQDSRSWHVADCHGGLVLLLRMSDGRCAGSVTDLIVFDPLTRNHRPISGPPPTRNAKGFRYGIIRDVFLLDGDDGQISISNFKVLHRHLNDASAPTACVFSRGDGEERGWRVLSRRLSDVDLFPRCSVYAAGHFDGSLYLGLEKGSRIIAIDSTSLVFSMVDLHTGVDASLFYRRPSSSFTVVRGAAASLLGSTSPQRTTCIVHVCGEELELFRRVQGSGEWVLEHTIANLSEAAATRGLLVCPEKKGMERMTWSTMESTNTDGAALAILSARRSYVYDERSSWFFSIDVNTMELRVLPEERYRPDTKSIFTYTLPWPQFLRACP